MARVLIAERVAEAGLQLLRDAGHDVDVRLELSPDELAEAIVGADALIVRSATPVTADLLAAADSLQVVGRAGVGLDNIDTEAATARGVIVANAPTSNSISAAEHTIALLLAVARNIPQAHAALRAGRWERSIWGGTELHDKTLGIVGLGRIGGLVAERAHAFGMDLIGYDPYISEERAAEFGVEMMDLDQLMSRADFVTLHLARTPDTIDLIDAAMLERAKPNLRIINAARGGIINEPDLADAVRSGVIAGAALDVFDDEPKTSSPLFELDRVVVTPHLGASTAEAQDRAGITIAEQVKHALDGDYVPFAVNLSAPGLSEVVRPFLPVAEQLGARFVRLSGGNPRTVTVTFAGEIGGFDTRLAELAVAKGLLSQIVDGPVSYVNADDLARAHGVEITTNRSTLSPLGFVNAITIEGDGHSLAATSLVPSGEIRIISIDGITIDIPPNEHLLVLVNVDVPGMIGRVGAILGDAGVNIDDMHIGRAHEGEIAIMALATTAPVPESIMAELAAVEGIRSVRSLDLG